MVKKAIIIDDERLARNELKKLLSEYPEIEIVAEAANAAEGIQTDRGTCNPTLFSWISRCPEKPALICWLNWTVPRM